MCKITNAFTLKETDSSPKTQHLSSREFESIFNIAEDKKTSKAWQFFMDLKNDKAKCNFCGKIMSYKGGGAYNLIRHTKSKHPHAFVAICEGPIINKHNRANISLTHATFVPSTSTASESESPENSIPSTSCTNIYKPKATVNNNELMQYFSKPLPAKKSEELNKMIVKLFTKNYLPFHLIEAPEFKDFILQLNPAYQLPSRKTLSNDMLSSLYNITKEQVKLELNQAEYVSLATDEWTSKPSDNYLAVTVHFYNMQAEFKTFMLECIQFSDRHTVENLSLELKKISDHWGITNKIVSVTSNNASNIKAAIKSNNWTQIPCFAHTLNVIIQSALKKLQNTIIKLKHLVDILRSSSLAMEKLRNMQKKLGEPELKIKQDNSTHWNFTFKMMERILQIKKSIISTIAINYPEVENINADDIEILNTAMEILSIFKDVTEEMSSEKNITISEVILIFNALKKKCLEFLSITTHPACVQRMAQCLLNELSTKCSDIEDNNIFAESTIIDPRFKKYGFSNEYCYNRACSNLKAIERKIQIKSQCDIETMLESTTSSRKRSIWDDFDKKVCNLIKNTNPTMEDMIELDKYLEEPLLPRSRDPAKWWFSKKDTYPKLYQVFKRRLCSAATSVPSKYIFSKTGQSLIERRNRLSGNKVSQILFLNSNL